MANWNDDTIETLKKLWIEGLSASQIAKELGEDFTKNSVIGKIHRLKMNTQGNRAPRPRASTAPRSRPAKSVSRNRRTAAKLVAGSVDRTFMSRLHIEPIPDINFLLPETVNFGSVRATQGLSGTCCKFPVGDPRDAAFRFCGAHAEGNNPYCDHHQTIAYRGTASKSIDVRKYA